MNNCLRFTALADGAAVAINLHWSYNPYDNPKPIYYYSKDDGKTWTEWTEDDGEIDIDEDQYVLFKGNNTHVSYQYNTYTQFVVSENVEVSGNIMSLVDDGACTATTIPSVYCFKSIFSQAALKSAKNLILPAPSLTEGCYTTMFNYCTELEEAPKLPATELAESCYQAMFTGCSKLKKAPLLPAATLKPWCYSSMFAACTSLEMIDTYALGFGNYATSQWVEGIETVGTFYMEDGVSLGRGKSGIPTNWNLVYHSQESEGIKFRNAGETDFTDDLNVTVGIDGGTANIDVAFYHGSYEYEYGFEGFEGYALDITITDNGGTETGAFRLESYTITVGENVTEETKGCLGVFYVTDKFGDKNYAYMEITQMGITISETEPIWKDIYYTGSTDTLDYYISGDRGVIYRGRAYVMPGNSNVKINISKICQDYLSNAINDGNLFLEDDFEFGSFDAVQFFTLYDEDGNELETYKYRYDWSYENVVLYPEDDLTEPINGHTDGRMIPIATKLMDDEYYRTKADASMYISGYCGEYALYYLQRNGAYASFLIEGNAKRTDNFERYTYNVAFDNNTAEFEESVYHDQISTDWKVSTGWLTDAQAKNLAFNLMPSNRIWLHELTANKIIPVVITDTSIDFKTFKNNSRQLVNYTFSLTESQKKQLL